MLRAKAESALVLCVYGPQPGKNCADLFALRPDGPGRCPPTLFTQAPPADTTAGPPAPGSRTPASDVRRAFPRPDHAGADSRRPHRDDHPGDPDPGRRHPDHLHLEPPRPCRRSRAHAVGELRGARDRRAEDRIRRGTAPAHLQSARQADEPRPAPPAQHDVVLPRPRRLRRDERHHRTPVVRDTREAAVALHPGGGGAHGHVLPLHEQHPADLRGAAGDDRRDRRDVLHHHARPAPRPHRRGPRSAERSNDVDADQSCWSKLAHAGAAALLVGLAACSSKRRRRAAATTPTVRPAARTPSTTRRSRPATAPGSAAARPACRSRTVPTARATSSASSARCATAARRSRCSTCRCRGRWSDPRSRTWRGNWAAAASATSSSGSCRSCRAARRS